LPVLVLVTVNERISKFSGFRGSLNLTQPTFGSLIFLVSRSRIVFLFLVGLGGGHVYVLVLRLDLNLGKPFSLTPFLTLVKKFL
jgi:hypothetical protein